MRPRTEPLHLVVVRGRQVPKAHVVPGVVDTVEDQCVEVDIQVDRAAEVLHEGDRTAPRIVDRPTQPPAAPQRREHAPDEDP